MNAGDPKGWCPNIFDNSKWIQADLGAVMSITGLITQGYVHDNYMKSYKVAYRDDEGAALVYIKNPDGMPTVVSARSLFKKSRKSCSFSPASVSFLRTSIYSSVEVILCTFEVICHSL